MRHSGGELHRSCNRVELHRRHNDEELHRRRCAEELDRRCNMHHQRPQRASLETHRQAESFTGDASAGRELHQRRCAEELHRRCNMHHQRRSGLHQRHIGRQRASLEMHRQAESFTGDAAKLMRLRFRCTTGAGVLSLHYQSFSSLC
ncbi:unnamed protein product, partial [Brassica oleracea]